MPLTPASVESNPFQASSRESAVRSRTRGSEERYRRAIGSLAGGVSSGLRRNARPYPLYFRRGMGSRVEDVDGNLYTDYTLAWGPLILGHSPASVAEAIAAQVHIALTFGAQHDLEIEVAERLRRLIPCADSVCFMNSGTEIVQLALRLARAATGRKRFIKFEGHYHGWDDSVLLSYHPTREEIEASRGQPIPAGQGQMPSAAAVIAEWNNVESVERVFREHEGEISAIICEPLVCNSCCLPPAEGFLSFLRDITAKHGALLIFDEVITGFRIALGGAQERFGIVPDLATYAKAVGAGTPLSVLAGRKQFMDLIARGDVIHAGSLNGNPISLTAAKAALDVLASDDGAIYPQMRSRGEALRHGIEKILREAGMQVATNGDGPVFHVLFGERPPRCYRDTLAADMATYSDFAVALLDEGILVLPDGRWYLSAAHSDRDIEVTLAAVERAAGLKGRE